MTQGERTKSEPASGERLRPSERHYVKPAAPPNPDDGLTPKIVSWFAARGIPEAILRRNGITGGRVYMPQLEEHVEAVMFPYHRDGELVNIKFRGPNKTFRMVKDAERVLYGLDTVGEDDQVIVCEGEIDALSFQVAGTCPALSVPDGAPAPDATAYESKFAFLASAEPLFRRLRVVILATDGDAPGRKLADELARRIGPEKCYRVAWPDGCKDANEVLVKHGADTLRDLVADAEPEPIAGIVTVRELGSRIEALYERGMPGGVPTGWLSVDRHYTVRTGLMTIVTGAPGMGKSQWIDNLIVNLARTQGWSIGVCSPENQPLERHAASMMAIYVGKPFRAGPSERMSHAEMVDARDWLDRHVSFVLPDEPTVDAVIERMRALVYRQGVKGVLIDPWNELEHTRPNGMTATEYISQTLTRLRRFARIHDLHLWIAAHPTKLVKGPDGQYPVATPYDISDSASWFSKADCCLSIWRDKLNPILPSQVHIQKVRFAETGEIGRVDLRFDKATGRYWDTTAEAR